MTKKTAGRAAGKDDARLLRAATMRSQTFDADQRTVDVVWTTGAAVQRFDWDGDYVEVLSLETGAVRLGRLNGGAPLLNTHSSWDLSDVIGSIVPGSARIDGGQGLATVKLSGAAADADTVSKIRDGVIRNISVGYLVHAFREATVDGVTTRTVTDWEPLEISAVPIPADAGAQIRAHGGQRRAAPKKVSARVATIRRLARKAGLPGFGEKHVKAGTSAEQFFELAAARLTTTPETKQLAKKNGFEDDLERGRRAAELLVGRGKRDDDAPPKSSDDDNDDQDATDRDVCPTCGQTIEEDHRDDDGDDDDRAGADDDDEGGAEDCRRSISSSRHVRTAPSAPRSRSMFEKPVLQTRRSEPVGGSARIERSDVERGAAEMRKLLGKRL